jgi:23S rRNA (pseudouridine1915-N3)-methyltransferase
VARHCPECGFVATPGANYCQKCGAFIGADEEPAEQATTATYRVDETGELVPVDVDQVASGGAALVIRAGGGRVGEAFAATGSRVSIGRSPEAELVERYLKRISWPTRVTELPDRGGSEPAAESGAVRILLDERGKPLSSMDLAKKLESWRDQGKREARFVLGAADGHTEAERRDADLLLSFGPATWPHLLARAMLAEQLFRAVSILANHPYHREG